MQSGLVCHLVQMHVARTECVVEQLRVTAPNQFMFFVYKRGM